MTVANTHVSLIPSSSPDVFRCRAGAFYPGVKVLFGEKVLHDDMLDWPWMKAWLYSVTGREFPENVVAALEALFINTSYPDARVWNNRIAAVVASSRGTSVMGLTSGLAASEAYIYGGQARIQGERFIRRVVKERSAGKSFEEIIASEMAAHGRIAGFGRPLAKEDERLAHTFAILKKHGLAEGPHISAMRELMKIMAERTKPLNTTNGALMAAVGADMGMSAEEFNHACTFLFSAGMPAVQREWLAEPDGAFMPVTCSQLRYDGVPARDWPNSQ